MSAKVTAVSEEKFDLGEGPYWESNKGTLLLVDIEKEAVLELNVATKETVATYTFDGPVGFAVPYADSPDHLLVGVGCKLIKYDRNKKEIIETLVEVEAQKDACPLRINDGKCDPAGRIIFGTMPATFTPSEFPSQKGKLYSFSKGHLEVLLEEVSLSNGLAWSRDNATMFYIDSSPDKCVYAFDYDNETGCIANQRTLVDMKEEAWKEHATPDGMTIDVQDNLWIACFFGSRVINVDSRNGKLLNKIEIPSINCTSVAFGRASLTSLFVTTAGFHNVPPEVAAIQPDGGKVFAVEDLGTKGRPPVPFAG